MDYQINFAQYRNHFSIPAQAVEDLKNVPSDYLKVLLLIFSNLDKEYSVTLMTYLLGLPEKTVRDAVTFWIERGLLLSGDGKKQTPFVVHDLKTPMAVSPANNSELRFLIDSLQETLGRPVTSSDVKTISYIFEYYRLPADVILMAVQYSVDLGKNSIKYIEKVCIEWFQNGITTYSEVEQYLLQNKMRRSREAKVKELFGIGDRKLIPPEEKCIRSWFEELEYDLEMIGLAYELTVKNTGKVAFAYTNRILQNWHEKGYRTADDVRKNIAQPAAKQRFVNQSGNSHDLNVLDQILDRKPELKG